MQSSLGPGGKFIEPGSCRKGTRERARGAFCFLWGAPHTSAKQVGGKVEVVQPLLRSERLCSAETPRARQGRRAGPLLPSLRTHNCFTLKLSDAGGAKACGGSKKSNVLQCPPLPDGSP